MTARLLVLTVALVLAALPLAIPQTAAQLTGSIAGTVCAAPVGYSYPYPYADKDSGECFNERLPGATVTATMGTLTAVQQSATTNENGEYLVENLPAGTYAVTITHAGFTEFTDSLAVDGAEVLGATLQGNDIKAIGTVRSEDGDPIDQATVDFCCSMDGSDYGRTGTDGKYSVALVAGFYSISIQAPGHQYAYDYRLADGTAVDFTMTPVPPTDATLRGVVRDQEDNPVVDARVSAYSYGNCCGEAQPMDGGESSTSPSYYGGENFTFTDTQGRYTLGVYAGQGSLNVNKEGHAGRYMEFSVQTGETKTTDVALMKYPEKTAHIEGRITGPDGKGLSAASISIRLPEFGLYECSVQEGSGGGSSGSGGTDVARSSIAPYPDYYDPGCAITVNDDGTFEGDVSPGYAIFQVYHNHWMGCEMTESEDGSSTTDCGPEFFSFSETLVLPADATTKLDVELRARPAADATVSGYLVDAESDKGISNGYISLNNQETYGYGSAQVDEDGSYSIRLRQGYHSVYVWAEGYLPWEGVLDIAAGDTPFDIKLTRGNESYGYYYGPYAHGVAESSASGDDGKAAGAGASPPGAPASDGLASGDTDTGETTVYEDLGGGLGPYDADERARILQQQEQAQRDDGIPSPGIVIVAIALLGAVVMARRRNA